MSRGGDLIVVRQDLVIDGVCVETTPRFKPRPNREKVTLWHMLAAAVVIGWVIPWVVLIGGVCLMALAGFNPG